MNRKKHMCPVCGFDGLQEPPYDEHNAPSYEICPCCGFEFGFDEAFSQDTFDSFRQKWLKSGAQWFTPELKPKTWDLKKQLSRLGKCCLIILLLLTGCTTTPSKDSSVKNDSSSVRVGGDITLRTIDRSGM